MLVVWLRGVDFGLWSGIGCSGQNVIIFSRSEAVDLEDERRRVDTVTTSRGRPSRRVSHLTY